MKKQRWKRALIRRRLFVSVLIVLQLAALVYFIHSTSRTSEILQAVLFLISVSAALYIIGKPGDPNAKLSWVFLILFAPLFGGLLYLLYSIQSGTSYVHRLLSTRSAILQPLFSLPNGVSGEPDPARAGVHAPLMRYLHACGYPAYGGTQSEYLSPGQVFHAKLLEELSKAERYIFLEFFIVEEGRMWDSLLAILERKVKEGLLVRLLYDDVGCFLTLPADYDKTLEARGIECRKFHPFQPFLSVVQNQRDHRKILVIDGKVAFTGGVNLADEYINAFEKHGYWQDAGICVKGKAAWSFTLAFMQLWDYCDELAPDTVRALYPWQASPCPEEEDGLVQPYADTPMDNELTGQSTYLRIIQYAKDYVYIATPYLIIDDILMSALTLAAKSGVDVRIITPYVPDKRLVHKTSRSYYAELVSAGVQIYEFTPGFMHSKVFVSDDAVASVGSVNLDYRSLYHHFECGCLLYGCDCIADIKADYLAILEKCHRISPSECKRSYFHRLEQEILRLFSPLM